VREEDREREREREKERERERERERKRESERARERAREREKETEKEREREKEREVCACVCLCVREREGGRERASERERERGRGRKIGKKEFVSKNLRKTSKKKDRGAAPRTLFLRGCAPPHGAKCLAAVVLNKHNHAHNLQWTYCVNLKLTWVVPDLIGRYLTEWAICCASKIGYVEGKYST